MASQTNNPAEVQSILDELRKLKQQVQSGAMTLLDYQDKAEPMINRARDVTRAVSSQSSSAANSINPIFQQFFSEHFAGSTTGQMNSGELTIPLPFSRSEYAKLPDNVLPSQDDVKSGLFDPASVPFERYKQATPQTNPGPGNQPPPTNNPNNLPQVTPSLPTNLDLRTDQGKTAQQGQYNAGVLQDALNKQYEVNKNAVGQLDQSLSGIPDLYKQEGISQETALTGLADQQKASRSQSLTDLASILADNQMNQFNRAIPDLAEQANTKGIYRSTGFGDILANKYRDLTADTQFQLAQKGISDRDTYLQAQSDALNKRLGFSEQSVGEEAGNRRTIGSANASALQSYGSGLGDVANAAISMQNAGLQRQFSLQDYLTQTQAAKDLASASQPKTSGKANTMNQVNAGLSTANNVKSLASKAPAAPK